MDSDIPNPETSRRRIVQVMAILTGSSLAGCNGLSQTDTPTETSAPTEATQSQTGPSSPETTSQTRTSSPETTTEVDPNDSAELSPPNIGTLIGSHNEFILDYSFTLGIELQQEKWTDGDLKEFVYRTSENGNRAQFVESVDREDEVNRLEQYFTPQNHHVLIDFVDSRSNSAELDIAQRPPFISGGSVLDNYLVGAALQRGEVVDTTEDDVPLIEYPINDHREQEFEDGYLVTVGDEYVAEFRMEWPDSSQSAHIHMGTQDVGETTVNPPG